MSNRFASLQDFTKDQKDALEDIAKHRDIPMRVLNLKATHKTGELLVYWESQGNDRMCAIHCLNGLLQGPILSPADLSKVARQLDERERQLVWTAAGGGEEVSNLLAGGSNNVADDGFFSIAVIEECLREKGYTCINVNNPQMRTSIMGASQREKGFLCNLKEHWFVLRKVSGQWFNLNSLGPAPKLVHYDEVESLLREAISGDGLIIYAIGGDKILPEPAPYLWSRLNRNQFFLSLSQIDELERMEIEANNAALSQTTPKKDEGHQWPTSGGRKLNETGPTAVNQQLTEEDPDLAEAIRISLAELSTALPQPPNEPDETVDASDVLVVQVRLPTGKALRRKFNLREHTFEHMFQWIEFSGHNDGILPHVHYKLIQSLPRREYVRTSRCIVNYFGEPLINCNGDFCNVISSPECTKGPLIWGFSAGREQLNLQILN